jgi:hypothetical protein
MAEAANCLTFIQSNFEDLSAEEQLDEVRKSIRKYATIDLKVPQLNRLSKLADLTALTIVSLALENGDEKFDDWL